MADNEVPSGTFSQYEPENDQATEVKSNRQVCQHSGFLIRQRDSHGKPLKQLVKQWDGKWVRKDFADERNPQDFIVARGNDEPDHGRKRPETDDTFIDTPVSQDDL